MSTNQDASPETMTTADFRERVLLAVHDGESQEVVLGPEGDQLTVNGNEALVLAKLQFRRSLRFVKVTFTEFVDLAEATFERSLRFENCTFQKGLRLRDVRVGGLLSLAGCTIQEAGPGFVDARRLRVDGLIDLSLVTSKVGWDLTNLRAGDDLRLDGIQVTAKLNEKEDIPQQADLADRGHLEREMLGKALNLEGADIAKHVYVYKGTDEHKRGATFKGSTDLRAKIGGGVGFLGAKLEHASGLAVDMQGAEVGESVLFRDGTTVEGGVDLRAKIGGQVAFAKATLERPNGLAVNMEGAEVCGSVFFRDGTSVNGEIDLRAKIGGQVDLAKATLEHPNGKAVNMVSAEVGGAVFFRDSTSVNGEIDLRAKIGGQVGIVGAILENLDGKAVNMVGAEVGRSVFFRHGTFLRGVVDLTQARLRNGFYATNEPYQKTFAIPVERDQNIKNLTILGELRMAYAEITGPCLFHHVHVWGRIHARHLTVHGDLDFCGSIIGPGDSSEEFAEQQLSAASVPWTEDQWTKARTWQAAEVERKPPEEKTQQPNTTSSTSTSTPVNFEMAEVHGSFWARGTRVLGTLTLEDAEIAGEANFDGGEVHGDLKLRCAAVRGRVFADEGTKTAYPLVSGHVDLSFAHLAQVDMRFDPAQEKLTPGTVNLTGATVGTLRLRGEPQRNDKQELIRPWLLTEGLKFQELETDQLQTPSRPPMSVCDWVRLLFWVVLLLIALYLAWRNGGVALAVLISLYVVAIAAALAMDHGLFLGYWCFRKPDTERQFAPLLGLLDMTYPFSRGFYLAVEAWLRQSGDDVTANEAFHKRRRRESGKPQKERPTVMSLDTFPVENWQRPSAGLCLWYKFVDFVAGYGVRTGRLLHLYVLLYLINIGVFLGYESVERPLSFTQPSTSRKAKPGEAKPAEAEPGEAEPGEVEKYWEADGGQPLPGEWGTLNAFFMASRVQVPFLGMVAENDWEPSSRPMLGQMTYEEYASLMMFINLILLPLIIAGLTGFLKK